MQLVTLCPRVNHGTHSCSYNQTRLGDQVTTLFPAFSQLYILAILKHLCLKQGNFFFYFIVDMISPKLLNLDQVIVAYKVIVLKKIEHIFSCSWYLNICITFFSLFLLTKNYEQIWPTLIFSLCSKLILTARTNFKVASWYSGKEQPQFLPILEILYYVLDWEVEILTIFLYHPLES